MVEGDGAQQENSYSLASNSVPGIRLLFGDILFSANTIRRLHFLSKNLHGAALPFSIYHILIMDWAFNSKDSILSVNTVEIRSLLHLWLTAIYDVTHSKNKTKEKHAVSLWDCLYIS